MNENFLHFIWKYQRFNNSNLKTTAGEKLTVYYNGSHNHDSGPDFEEARIRIGTVDWAGNIEVHTKSSDWIKHDHSNNQAYETVILHVVWEHDQEILIQGEPIPTLALKERVDKELIDTYEDHISSMSPIACASHSSEILDISFFSMFDKVMIERLKRKAGEILAILKANQNDWDEASYQTLARNFGFSTNKYAFSELSKRTPFSILKKNINNIIGIEALLFGQAGFLENVSDPYQQSLAKEFSFLKSKYELPPSLSKHEWKFGKMRPANFPSLRIAQFASLLYSQPRFFTHISDSEQSDEIIRLFTFELPDYWNSHYDFGKERKKPVHTIGKHSKDHLLINTVAPLLTAYAQHTKNDLFMERAVALLEQITPENNRITKHWSGIDRKPKNAFESQAQIQLFNEYCKKRKCLSCAVGVSLLSR